MRIRALEEGLEHLVTAYQENLVSFRKAFNMTDAHLWVLKRIAEDMSVGKLKSSSTDDLTRSDATSPIDLKHYYEAFNEHQRDVADAATSKREEAIKAAEKKAKQEAKEGEPVEFGGDQHASP